MTYPYGEHMSVWGMRWESSAWSCSGPCWSWPLPPLSATWTANAARASRPRPLPPAAEQVLAERFARGEIDADEYRQRLDMLRRAGRSAVAGSDRGRG